MTRQYNHQSNHAKDNQKKYLEMDQDQRQHVLFGSTKIVQTCMSTIKAGSGIRAGGCVGYILQAGFGTSQEKLIIKQ